MKTRKLPDAEFAVMKALWQHTPPVTSGMIMEALAGDDGHEWKPQTVHTLLTRLEDRGFVRAEKKGRDKLFYPLVKQDEYLKFETQSFMKQYHESSLLNLVNALYDGERLGENDVDELIRWANERRPRS